MSSFPTIKNFIKTALIPLGHTMYVYGGGWNEEDTFAGTQSRTIGECNAWQNFFLTQTKKYNFRNFLHCSSLGLDCTGYIGWAIYNILCTENLLPGYVFESSFLGYKLRELGLGAVTEKENVTNRLCGDIFFSSIHRHAYICVGECSDNSLLLLHSSPPGVMLSGTPSPHNRNFSVAQNFAKKFMRKNYPCWYCKFPDTDRGITYLYDYDRFRFYKVIVSDPEGLMQTDPIEILSSFTK